MNQDSGDRGCCCSCTQCPPWWVTMGFVPPLQLNQGRASGPSGAGAAPPSISPSTPPAAPPTSTSGGQGQSSNPLGALGGILGPALGLLGGLGI